MNRFLIGLTLCVILLPSCNQNKSEKINVRLQWIPQAQFGGYIVAKELGYYEDAGLDVELQPAGPDLKPHMTVASGTDQIGIGVPNQIIAARSNGVPLVAISQIFQDSPNRYVLKAENRIDSLQQIQGKKVGLWLGGDEAEFVSMLNSIGLTLDDIDLIPQEFTVIPFLEDKYVLSQVTVYNELNLIRNEGYDGDKLQVLSPADFDSAIPGDMIFTTESYYQENFDQIVSFLSASIKGWQFCINNPEKAVGIILKYNPELERDNQISMMMACNDLMASGNSLEMGLGFISQDDYENVQRIMMLSNQIDKKINIDQSFDLKAWRSVPDSIKAIR